MDLLATEIDAGISSRLREIAGLAAAKQAASIQTYSLARTLTRLVSKERVDGYEGEIHQELSRLYGPSQSASGVLVPWRALVPNRRDLSTANASALVGVEQQPVADVLRAWSVVANAGVTVVGGLRADQTVPRIMASSTGYWLEGDGAQIPAEGQASIGRVSATPHTAAAYLEISHQLRQSAPDVDGTVRLELVPHNWRVGGRGCPGRQRIERRAAGAGQYPGSAERERCDPGMGRNRRA